MVRPPKSPHPLPSTSRSSNAQSDGWQAGLWFIDSLEGIFWSRPRRNGSLLCLDILEFEVLSFEIDHAPNTSLHDRAGCHYGRLSRQRKRHRPKPSWRRLKRSGQPISQRCMNLPSNKFASVRQCHQESRDRSQLCFMCRLVSDHLQGHGRPRLKPARDWTNTAPSKSSSYSSALNWRSGLTTSRLSMTTISATHTASA